MLEEKWVKGNEAEYEVDRQEVFWTRTRIPGSVTVAYAITSTGKTAAKNGLTIGRLAVQAQILHNRIF